MNKTVWFVQYLLRTGSVQIHVGKNPIILAVVCKISYTSQQTKLFFLLSGSFSLDKEGWKFSSNSNKTSEP